MQPEINFRFKLGLNCVACRLNRCTTCSEAVQLSLLQKWPIQKTPYSFKIKNRFQMKAVVTLKATGIAGIYSVKWIVQVIILHLCTCTCFNIKDHS